MTGLLRIKGTIDLSQFWPVGSSDADTTKIHVTVSKGAFSFAVDGANFAPTHVYDNAFVKGASRKKLIDKKNRITVRLQGIDAPELHYKAAPLRKKGRPEVTEAKRAEYNAINRTERRQYLAETATIALFEKLKNYHKTTVACVVHSFIDRPNEVADTYGRFVGNIAVGTNHDEDLNLWLTKEGWCYPTFYSSMEPEEINALLEAMHPARKRVWAHYSQDLLQFDPDLKYRGTGVDPDEKADRGPIIMPKLFRRQVAYEMEKAADIFHGSFEEFLERSPDGCYELQDFLKSGPHSSTTLTLDEFVAKNDFALKPHEIVFREKYSDVVDANGKRIDQF